MELSYPPARAHICKRLRSPGIDYKVSIPPAYVAWLASMSNRVLVPATQDGNRFLGSLKGLQIRAQAKQAGRIDSFEAIPGLLKSLKIRAQIQYIKHWHIICFVICFAVFLFFLHQENTSKT
jgi:hypothetical protein